MIALVNHPGAKSTRGLQIQSPSPPIGLAYLGAYLARHGLAYTAVDACGEALDVVRPHPRREGVLVQGLSAAEVVARVPSDTRLVGMSCLFSHCWELALEIAEALRKALPDALFVAGGEHPTALPEGVLAGGLFDVVALGEGEETLLELAQRALAGDDWRDVHGIARRGAAGEVVRTPARRRIASVDDLPYPDWDAWSIERYIDAQQTTGLHLGRSIPILGSRGCPYACTFCSNEAMWTRRYVMRDAKGLVDEMEAMVRRYGVESFAFMDSTFVVNRRKTLAFCEELSARGLGVTYQLPAGTRCEAFDDELARALERSGLRNLALAPESGSVEVLSATRKQVDLARLLDAARTLLRTRITVGCFFVIGFPSDTRATLRETLSLVRRLALLGVHDVTISQFTPYPGTADWDDLERRGQVSADGAELFDVIDFFGRRDRAYCDAISAGELQRWLLWMFVNFYAISLARRPWRLARNLWTWAREGVEHARYVRFVSEVLVRRRRWRRHAAG